MPLRRMVARRTADETRQTQQEAAADHDGVVTATFADTCEARQALAALRRAGFPRDDIGVLRRSDGRVCRLSLRRMSRQTARAGAWLFGALGAMIAVVANAVATLGMGSAPPPEPVALIASGGATIALCSLTGALMGWLLGRLTRQPPLLPAPDVDAWPGTAVFVHTDSRQREAARILRQPHRSPALRSPLRV